MIDGILRSALMSGFNKRVSDRIKMVRPEWRTMASFAILDLARNIERDIEDKEKARPQKVMYVGPNGKFLHEKGGQKKKGNNFRSQKHNPSNVTCYRCRRKGHYARNCTNNETKTDPEPEQRESSNLVSY